MYTALTRLGYQCQHTRETFKTNAFVYWSEAIRAKYEGKGKAYEPRDWDKLLGGYDVSLMCDFASLTLRKKCCLPATDYLSP